MTYEGNDMTTKHVWNREVTFTDPCDTADTVISDIPDQSYTMNTGDFKLTAADSVKSKHAACSAWIRFTDIKCEGVADKNGNKADCFNRKDVDLKWVAVPSSTVSMPMEMTNFHIAASAGVYTISYKVGMASWEVKTLPLEKSFTLTIVDGCPSGPSLTGLVAPKDETDLHYIGRAEPFRSYPRWSTVPASCPLDYTWNAAKVGTAGTTEPLRYFYAAQDKVEDSIRMKIGTYINSQLFSLRVPYMTSLPADNFASPWTFVITAAWDGKVIADQSMDYKLTMTEDPCSPGPTTIDEDAKNQVHSFDFFLRGSMASTYDWKPLVFDPKNLCPQFEYQWTPDTSATVLASTKYA